MRTKKNKFIDYILSNYKYESWQYIFFLITCTYQIDKLNNTNYNTWSIELQMLLMRNEIWGVVGLN